MVHPDPEPVASISSAQMVDYAKHTEALVKQGYSAEILAAAMLASYHVIPRAVGALYRSPPPAADGAILDWIDRERGWTAGCGPAQTEPGVSLYVPRLGEDAADGGTFRDAVRLAMSWDAARSAPPSREPTSEHP